MRFNYHILGARSLRGMFALNLLVLSLEYLAALILTTACSSEAAHQLADWSRNQACSFAETWAAVKGGTA